MLVFIVRQSPNGDTTLLSFRNILLVRFENHTIGFSLCLILCCRRTASTETYVKFCYTNDFPCGSKCLEHLVNLCFQSSDDRVVSSFIICCCREIKVSLCSYTINDSATVVGINLLHISN